MQPLCVYVMQSKLRKEHRSNARRTCFILSFFCYACVTFVSFLHSLAAAFWIGGPFDGHEFAPLSRWFCP